VTEEGLTDLLVDLGRMGLGADRVDHDELLKLRSAGAVSEHVREVADALLASREAEVGAEGWATIERFVLLRTIDSLWVEHLTELDDMRRGIGLRGYAQQDPLNEFRKEAFRLYEELSGFIRHQVASTIFRVQLQAQPQPQSGVFALPGPGQRAAGSRNGGVAGRGGRALASGVRTMAGPGVSGTASSSNGGGGVAAAAGAGGAGQQARPGYTPSGAKIGRNDACWCGSGRKYKKCHGA
jgi:preprotein translocase subunit SecA